tara:strand:+ start:37 stop:564 length:528 start_codon:yes stop_codon:yes gene_type:complete
MYDNYCTLEEAWGKDFKKDDKKKKKRERESQKFTHPLLNDTVDDQILIAPPHEWARENPQEQRKKIESSKPIISDLMSTNELRPYQNVRAQRNFHYPESNLSDIVNITRKEYENLKEMANKYVSDASSTVTNIGSTIIPRTSESEQFNTLLLYIFTGIFLLISHDMMFQLGKKAY